MSAAAREWVNSLGESGLRPSKALTACAVSALAMVFSVQQGEHGPLVVYKLTVPPSAAPAAPAPALPASPATPTTVVIENPTAGAPAATFGSLPLQAPDTAAHGVPDTATVYRIVEEMQDSGMLINENTGTPLTLQQVNDAVAWRRETAAKLRQVPIAPRF